MNRIKAGQYDIGVMLPCFFIPIPAIRLERFSANSIMSYEIQELWLHCSSMVSPNHFGRVFKRYYGITPAAFKKTVQSEDIWE